MKKAYIAPELVVFNVEAESMVCQSPIPVIDGTNGEVERAVKERNDFDDFSDVVDLF